MSAIWIILIVAAVAAVWAISVYNQLISLNVRCDEADSDIEVQLKRRYDLIPNLVESVKGYATHEKDIFENVTKARSEAIGAKGMQEKAQAENQLSQALKSVFAVAENYPDLKANENFMKLQEELTDTEDKIQASRRFYNANVRDFNIKIQIFPSSIVANMKGFKKRELFDLDNEAAKEPVKVDFKN